MVDAAVGDAGLGCQTTQGETFGIPGGRELLCDVEQCLEVSRSASGHRWMIVDQTFQNKRSTSTEARAVASLRCDRRGARARDAPEMSAFVSRVRSDDLTEFRLAALTNRRPSEECENGPQSHGREVDHSGLMDDGAARSRCASLLRSR